MENIFANILLEVLKEESTERRPGEVWETGPDTYAAMNLSGERRYGFSSEESAQRFARGEVRAKAEEEPKAKEKAPSEEEEKAIERGEEAIKDIVSGITERAKSSIQELDLAPGIERELMDGLQNIEFLFIPGFFDQVLPDVIEQYGLRVEDDMLVMDKFDELGMRHMFIPPEDSKRLAQTIEALAAQHNINLPTEKSYSGPGIPPEAYRRGKTPSEEPTSEPPVAEPEPAPPPREKADDKRFGGKKSLSRRAKINRSDYDTEEEFYAAVTKDARQSAEAETWENVSDEARVKVERAVELLDKLTNDQLSDEEAEELSGLIQISSTGRLVPTAGYSEMKRGTMPRALFISPTIIGGRSEAAAFATYVYSKLKERGHEIKGTPSTVGTDISTEIKPAKILGEEGTEVIPDFSSETKTFDGVEYEHHSISFEGVKLETVPPLAIGSDRFNKYVAEYESQGMSRDEAEAKAKELSRKISAFNLRLVGLAEEQKSGGDTRLRLLGSGEEAATVIRDRLVGKLRDLVNDSANLSDEDRERLTGVLGKFENKLKEFFEKAKSAEPPLEMKELGKFWRNELLPILTKEGSDIFGGTIPAIAELLTATWQAASGKNIYVPMSESFGLVDTIAISPDIDFANIDQLGAEDLYTKMTMWETSIDIRQVKRNEGSASSDYKKVMATDFDSTEARDTLRTWTSTETLQRLKTLTGEDLDRFEAETVESVRAFIDDIRKEYNIGSDVSDDQIIDNFLNGRVPSQRSSVRTTWSQLSVSQRADVTDTGRRRYGLFVLMQYATSAVYNQHATAQGYNIIIYKDKGSGIDVADGVDSMTYLRPKIGSDVKISGDDLSASALRSTSSVGDYRQIVERLNALLENVHPKKRLLMMYVLKEMLMEETEASKIAKQKGLIHLGGGWYSVTGEAPATHKSVNGGRELKAIDPSKLRAGFAGREKIKRTSATFKGAAVDDSEYKEGEEVAEVPRPSAVRATLEDLIDNLNDENISEEESNKIKQKIRNIIKRYNIKVSGQTRQLKMYAGGKSRPLVSKAGESLKYATMTREALLSHDIEIEVKENVNNAGFKPNRLYTPDPTEVVEEDGVRYLVNAETKDRLGRIYEESDIEQVQNDAVERVRQSLSARNRELSPDQENRIRRYVEFKLRRHIELMGYLSSEGAEISVFSGDSGKSKIREAIISELNNTPGASSADKKLFLRHFERILKASTFEEISKAYAQMHNAIKGTSLSSTLPYLAESVFSLVIIAEGGTAIIPMSETNPLADVFSLATDVLIDDEILNGDLIESDYDDTETTKMASIKSGEGAASSNNQKITRAQYGTSDDEVSGDEVMRDLQEIESTYSSENLFSRQPTEEQVSGNETKTMQMLERHRKTVLAYFGLPDNLSNEELFDFLSSGRRLICKDDEVTRPEDAKLFEKIREGELADLNERQWRMSAVLNSISEALHNRTVQQQQYRTGRFDRYGISVADGVSLLTGIKNQFYKGLAMRGNPPILVPDHGQMGFSVVASRDEESATQAHPDIRTLGNPCLTEQSD